MTAIAEAGPTLRCDIAGGVARVTLDRPPLNVLTLALLDGLAREISAVRADPSVKVLLLEGAGKCFCAGVDVADHTASKVETMLARFHGVIRALLSLEMPVVASVHGAALGGGMELALACDIVLARDDARFGQPEIKLGVFPPAAAVLLPRIAGRQRALDLILSGRTVSAEEAYAMGIATQVFTTADFAVDVRQYVKNLASLSGPVLRLAKRATLDALGRDTDVALEHAERMYLGPLMELPDAHEGIAAFMAKRAPAWKEG
jgi:cyclohexa-1,5-dienecarbonyl-CoA hydratase